MVNNTWVKQPHYMCPSHKFPVMVCRTAQHAGEIASSGNTAPSVAEVLDAMKVPAEVKKTN